LVVGVVSWVVVFGETGWRRVHAEEETVRELREQVDQLRASTEEVRRRVEEIREPASPLLEKIAREQYLMKREGEEVYHVLEAEPEERDPSSDPPR
jgi:cell division protein FtsB